MMLNTFHEEIMFIPVEDDESGMPIEGPPIRTKGRTTFKTKRSVSLRNETRVRVRMEIFYPASVKGVKVGAFVVVGGVKERVAVVEGVRNIFTGEVFYNVASVV